MARCFRRLRGAFTALASACLMAGAASASVSIVNDGANGQSAVIRIQSAIHKGDLADFERALDQVSRSARTRINDAPFITVELNSPGGDVVEAIGIGREIYEHSAMTLVRPGQECVSACVFILMAGAVHTPTGAAIGVHRPMLVSWRNMSSAEAHAKYDGLMRYLRDYFLELGVSEAAYDIMMRTDSDDMRYFTWWELDRLGLRGEGPGWRARFAQRQAAAAQPAVVSPRTAGDMPSLPKIDESYRYVVFMPGDFSAKDYFDGVDIRKPSFAWDSLDQDAARLDWESPDITGFLIPLWDLFEPVWWLLALLVLELMRGGLTVWPDHPSQRRRDQWRLAPLRPRTINPVSAPAPGPASPGRARYGGSGSSMAR